MMQKCFQSNIEFRNKASIGPAVLEENMFENVDIHTYIHTHLRTTEAYLYYKLTNAPKVSCELIIYDFSV